MVAARMIAGQLLDRGISASVIEGWIQFEDEDGSRPEDMRFAHTWVEVDGEVIDPTLEQFHDYLDCYVFERQKVDTVVSAKYLADSRLNTGNPEIFFDDGVIPEPFRRYFPG